MSGRQPSTDTIAVDQRGSILSITVAPRASRSGLELTAEGTIRVRVAAPPVEGAANEAVRKLLSHELDVPRARLEILSGATGRRKRILCAGVTPEELMRRLQAALAAQR